MLAAPKPRCRNHDYLLPRLPDAEALALSFSFGDEEGLLLNQSWGDVVHAADNAAVGVTGDEVDGTTTAAVHALCDDSVASAMLAQAPGDDLRWDVEPRALGQEIGGYVAALSTECPSGLQCVAVNCEIM